MEKEPNSLVDQIEIVPLQRQFLKGAFNKEENIAEYEKGLINWFKTVAWPAHSEKCSRTFVICMEENVIGYLTLVNAVVETLESEKYTLVHGIQVVQLAKLYIAQEYRSKRVGQKALDFSLSVAQEIDNITGCKGLIVDSNNNERTLAFYGRYGFEKVQEQDDGETILMFFNLKDFRG